MGAKKTAIRTTPSETAHWVIDDSDDTTWLLRRLGSGRPVVVEHDGVGWVCSEDGQQPGRAGQAHAMGQCVHVQVVGRSLSVPLAATLAARIASTHAKRGTEKAEKVERRSQADIIAAGAEVRAKKAQEHDEAFVAATPVVVRQATDEDRRKLEEARARRARTFQAPDGCHGRFAG